MKHIDIEAVVEIQRQEVVAMWGYNVRASTNSPTAWVARYYADTEMEAAGLTEEIKQGILQKATAYSPYKMVLMTGLLPVIKDKTVEVWRWPINDGWENLCRFRIENGRVKLTFVVPQAEMILVDRIRGDLYMEVQRILKKVLEENPDLKRRADDYMRKTGLYLSSFPTGFIPVKGVEMHIANNHISAICKGVAYAFNGRDCRLVALQAVATTKEALKSLFGTLNSNNGGAKTKRLRLFFTDRREGGTITLYPLQAASKRRYRSTFVPLPDGTGWLATFVHVAALPAEGEEDDEGCAYLLFEEGLTSEEKRRRILRLLNARLPFPFPETWADVQSPQARQFWTEADAKQLMSPVTVKGEGFDSGISVCVGNIHAWRKIVEQMN